MQRCFGLGVAALLLAGVPAFAQQFRGSLSGRVLDQQQAAVPGAKIHAVESETGAKFQTVTNGDGTYVLTFPAARTIYGQRRRRRGSNATSTRRSASPPTNASSSISTLEVGTIDQSVTVSAEGSMLDTASPPPAR